MWIKNGWKNDSPPSHPTPCAFASDTRLLCSWPVDLASCLKSRTGPYVTRSATACFVTFLTDTQESQTQMFGVYQQVWLNSSVNIYMNHMCTDDWTCKVNIPYVIRTEMKRHSIVSSENLISLPITSVPSHQSISLTADVVVLPILKCTCMKYCSMYFLMLSCCHYTRETQPCSM